MKLTPAADIVANRRIENESAAAKIAIHAFEVLTDAIAGAVASHASEVIINMIDNRIPYAVKLLDEGGYIYEVQAKGANGQIRDFGTTTPIKIRLDQAHRSATEQYHGS